VGTTACRPDQLWKASDFFVSGPDTCWSLQCLQWAIAQGRPWGVWPESVCRTAIDNKILRSSETIKEAERQSRRTWAHAHGCPCSCAR
jgi:hypothetical protein